MHFLRVLLLLTTILFLCGSACWGNEKSFSAFFDQRQLVASITFDHASSKLSKSAMRLLEAAIPNINGPACEARMIRIEGFAGPEGSDETAFRLSMNRAYSVARFLEGKGIPCLVGMNGYGKLLAGIGDNTSDFRVEIASYPKMFLFDFENATYVDIHEVKFND